LYFSPDYYEDDEMKENEKGGKFRKHGRNENVYEKADPGT